MVAEYLIPTANYGIALDTIKAHVENVLNVPFSTYDKHFRQDDGILEPRKEIMK